MYIIKPRENKRGNKFCWRQYKDNVWLQIFYIKANWHSLFTCSFNASWPSKMTPRLWAALEKWMSLTHRWRRRKTDSRSRAYQKKNLFCRHITDAFSELPRPSHPKSRFWWSGTEWKLQKKNQICTNQCHLQTCDERQSSDWLHQKEAEYKKWRELVPSQNPGGPNTSEVRERILFH